MTFLSPEQKDRLILAGLRKLGLDFWKLQDAAAEEDRIEAARIAQEQQDQIKRDEELKRQQQQTNEKDWEQPIVGSHLLRDFVMVIPASDRSKIKISRKGTVSGPECWCGFQMKHDLVQELHLLLNDPNHNWIWYRRKHTHRYYKSNPYVSGFVIELPFCIYLDRAAMSQAKLGKPYKLLESVPPQVDAGSTSDLR